MNCALSGDLLQIPFPKRPINIRELVVVQSISPARVSDLTNHSSSLLGKRRLAATGKTCVLLCLCLSVSWTLSLASYSAHGMWACSVRIFSYFWRGSLVDSLNRNSSDSVEWTSTIRSSGCHFLFSSSPIRNNWILPIQVNFVLSNFSQKNFRDIRLHFSACSGFDRYRTVIDQSISWRCLLKIIHCDQPLGRRLASLYKMIRLPGLDRLSSRGFPKFCWCE